MLTVAKLDGKSEVFVFEQHDQLIEYLEWQRECIELDVGNLIRGNVSPDNWDHYYGTCSRSLHLYAVMQIMFGKAAPFFAHAKALDESAKTLFSSYDKSVDDEQVLVVNMNGGHQNVSPDRLFDAKPFEIKAPELLHLQDGSDILVLENDPELDPWTVKNLTGKYSYITQLRKLSSTQLHDAMKTFRKQVPDDKRSTLFVYTTGIDGNQMADYVKTALLLARGFDVFVLVKSAGHQPCFDAAGEAIIAAGKEFQLFDQHDKQLQEWIDNH